MKYKVHLITGSLLITSGIVGGILLTKPPQKAPLKLETAAVTVPITKPAQTVAPTTQAAPTLAPQHATTTPVTTAPSSAPAPTAAPETSLEWWQNLKNTYSDDEVSCMLDIVLHRYQENVNQPISTLQSELDYATSHYPSICLADVALNRAIQSRQYSAY